MVDIRCLETTIRSGGKDFPIFLGALAASELARIAEAPSFRESLDYGNRGHRLGSIRANHEWDAVLMVLLDENLEATAIYEAERPAVLSVLTAPGSRARNERGAMSISKFKSIGVLRWQRPGT